MGRARRDELTPPTVPPEVVRRAIAAAQRRQPAPVEADPGEPAAPRKMFLGRAVPRGYGGRPRLSLEAAASFATLVDTARARAAVEGRTLIYTVRWG